jgi:hypothetical protein
LYSTIHNLLAVIFDHQSPGSNRSLPSDSPEHCLPCLFATRHAIFRGCRPLCLSKPSTGCHHSSIHYPAYGGRKSTSVQPPSSIHTLSLRGTDNPASRYQPLRFCLWTRGSVVPHKTENGMVSEPVSFLFHMAVVEALVCNRGAVALASSPEKCVLI